MTKTILNCLNHEVFAISTSYKGIKSAMIATWVMPATLAKGKLRVMTALSVSNFTTGLILKRKKFILHLLSEKNLQMVPLLGLYSSREIDKLSELKIRRSPAGLPVIQSTCGWVECSIEKSIKGGDRIFVIARGGKNKLNSKLKPLKKREAFARLPFNVRRLLEEKYLSDGVRDQTLFNRI